MLELELTQCEYASRCHLVDTLLCVSRSRTENSISELIWYLRGERDIVISKFKVVDRQITKWFSLLHFDTMFHLIST